MIASYHSEKVALTPNEAAKAISIGRTTLYKHIKLGHLRARKCGRRTLILSEDIFSFLSSLEDVGVTND